MSTRIIQFHDKKISHKKTTTKNKQKTKHVNICFVELCEEFRRDLKTSSNQHGK